MNFTDKAVVVTGGSKGFGKAFAERMIKQGARVLITSTNEDEVKATASEIGAEYTVADASLFDDTLAVAKQAVDTFGRIDVWVNNAGVQIAPSNLEDVDLERLHYLYGVNFFGYFNGCKAVLPIMKKQGNGLIININSTAGLSGKPKLSAYVSSKFALKGMTESLREELADTGVAVYQIFPGGMQTDIYHEQVPEDIDQYMSVDYAIEKVMTNLSSEQPEEDLVIKRPSVG
ncbi:MAG: SDR family oxidoreductase [Candidatus Saccharibacteria bacterium]|nr:SDR family oxidoreductase [Candidatus Saccharibacteria bacterium]